MKGQIIINELQDNSIETIGSFKFEKVLLVTEGAVAMMGLREQKNVVFLLDRLLEKIAITAMNIDETSGVEDIKDAIYFQAVTAINLVMLAIGPFLEYPDFADKHDEIEDTLRDVTKLAMKIIRLSNDLEIELTNKTSATISEVIMDELDRWEKKNDE